MNSRSRVAMARAMGIVMCLLLVLGTHPTVRAQSNVAPRVKVNVKDGKVVNVEREPLPNAGAAGTNSASVTPRKLDGPAGDNNETLRSPRPDGNPGPTMMLDTGEKIPAGNLNGPMPQSERRRTSSAEMPGQIPPVVRLDGPVLKSDDDPAVPGILPANAHSLSAPLASVDLYVVSVQVLDGAGPGITYRYTIGNNGPGAVTGTFENHIYLSTNTLISTADYLIDSRARGSGVPAGGSYTTADIPVTVSGVPDGTYYLGVITDGSGAITETNENNNTGYDSSPQVTITAAGTYDLYVSSVEVLDGTGPSIQFRYTIGNNGTARVSSGFDNDIYLSTNISVSTSDYKIDSRTASSDVPAGGTYTCANLTCTVSGVPDGSYYLGVITDGSDVVAETNESNNTGYDNTPQVSLTTPGTFDLYVSSVQVLDATGPVISFRFVIGNSGTSTVTANFADDVYLSTNSTITSSDYLIGSWITIDDMPGGSTHTSGDLSCTLSGIPDGSYYLGMIVDGHNIVAETNEANNTGYDSSPQVTVSSAATYDLYVAGVEVFQETGPTIGYRYSIGNHGTGMVSSGTFENHIYLSTNTTISSSDYRIDIRSASHDVPAGGSYTSIDLSCTISGVPDGSYYLGIIADATDAIAETSEGNNTGYDSSPQVSISSPGTYDLDVVSVEVLDGTGPDITYRYAIGNNGSAAVSVNFQNETYLSTNTTISPADYLIASRTATSNVPAGGSYTTGDLSNTVSGVPDGTYYLGVITDAANIIAETNENNNTGYDSSPQVGISASGTFDLYVSSVEVLDETCPDIAYRYTIGNNGTADVSVLFENHIYLSSNSTITSTDYQIDSWTSGGNVAAGGVRTSGTLTCSVSGIPDGSYYLGVITDGTHIVTETNESNNAGYDNSLQLSVPTGVAQEPDAVPSAFRIHPNYPNPFNPSTVLEFELPAESDVQISIFNTLGQEVERVVSERMRAGVFRTTWEPRNIAAGVYYCRFVAKPVEGMPLSSRSPYVETLRMVFIK